MIIPINDSPIGSRWSFTHLQKHSIFAVFESLSSSRPVDARHQRGSHFCVGQPTARWFWITLLRSLKLMCTLCCYGMFRTLEPWKSGSLVTHLSHRQAQLFLWTLALPQVNITCSHRSIRFWMPRNLLPGLFLQKCYREWVILVMYEAVFCVHAWVLTDFSFFL